MEEKPLSHEESLRLINTMLNKAKNSYHDTGSSAILWGVVISMCALATYCEIKGLFNLPFNVWMLTVIAVIPTIYIAIKQGRESKAKYYEDRMMDMLWTCFGIGIALLGIIVYQMSVSVGVSSKAFFAATGSKMPFRLYEFTSALYLFWYGLPTLVTGLSTRFSWMTVGGIVCWVCAVISLYTKVDVDMLLTALGAITAWLIPGLVLRKRYRSATRNV